MKIALLITTHSKHIKRFENQLFNLNYSKQVLILNNITTFFLVDDDFNTVKYKDLNFIKTKEIDKYSNLYRKLLSGYEYLFNNYNFDYIIKIDDDTLVDFTKINLSKIKDYSYAGHLIKHNTDEGRLSINFLSCNKTINLFPFEFNNLKEYIAGNFYILSKHSVQKILEFKVPKHFNDYYINEDSFFGYIMQKNNIFAKDISLSNINILNNKLMVTPYSIHPVSVVLFKKLIGKELEMQLDIINSNKIFNLGLRSVFNNKIDKFFISTLKSFMDSKYIGN